MKKVTDGGTDGHKSTAGGSPVRGLPSVANPKVGVMTHQRIAYGHRLIGEPVKVDEGYEACCECGATGWGLTAHDAVVNLVSHFDRVGVAS